MNTESLLPKIFLAITNQINDMKKKIDLLELQIKVINEEKKEKKEKRGKKEYLLYQTNQYSYIMKEKKNNQKKTLSFD